MIIVWHDNFNAAVSASGGNAAMITGILIIIWAVIIARRCGPAELSCTGRQTANRYFAQYSTAIPSPAKSNAVSKSLDRGIIDL